MFVLDASNIKKARITIFLITFNTLLYLFFSFGNLEDLFYLLVQINSKVVYNLELWRLITSMFLHGDALHLFSNMVSLLIFGSYIELSFSKVKFVLIYFVSGFLGSLFTVFLLPLINYFRIDLCFLFCIFFVFSWNQLFCTHLWFIRRFCNRIYSPKK